MHRRVFYLTHILFSAVSGFEACAQASSSYPPPVPWITTFQDFMIALVELVVTISVPIIVICIIYSGYLFVIARDNEKQITKARRVFLWTIIGAGVLLGARVIATVIQSTITSL